MATKDDVAVGILAIVGIIVGIPVIFLLASLLNGWVLVKLWAWFIAPVFHLPELGIWWAIGIAITIGQLTKQSLKDDRKFSEHLALAVISPLMTLGLAWMIHVIATR